MVDLASDTHVFHGACVIIAMFSLHYYWLRVQTNRAARTCETFLVVLNKQR